MTAAELRELVQALRSFGTDLSDVEAKRARDGLPRSVRETLSSFSNTAGGVLVLGLDEEQRFAAVGVADPKRVSEALTSLASAEMEPPLRPLVQLHQFEGTVLVTAEVPELDPSQKPCFYRGAGMTKGSFVRVGDSDRQLSHYEVHLLVASRGQPRHDEEPVSGAGPPTLEPGAVAGFCERLRASRPSFEALDDLSVLRRSRVLVSDPTGGECVSVGGLLALGTHPQEFFPQLNLTFVHYPTSTGTPLASGERFLDNVTIDGSIPTIVREALAVLRRNMTRRAVVSGAGRNDVWEYPEPALREALVNALVHRDLSSASRGTQVQVEMFPDRLHVGNAGGLFGPVTLERLGEEGVSSSRNALLMRILEDVPLAGEHRTVCENRGSGIRTMIYALRQAGMTLPIFENRVATFDVTFPNHTLMSDRTVRWIAALGEETLTDSQVTALAMLRDGATLDNARYRTATGVDSRVATAELQDLVARELVTQVGERRWATYRLTSQAAAVDPDAASGGSRRLSPADRRVEILGALGDEVLSRAEIAARTGLPDQAVGRWLRVLRREGRVQLTTGSPQSRLARYRRMPEPQQATLF
jgi:ATP-dependent DNA helicase RecG